MQCDTGQLLCIQWSECGLSHPWPKLVLSTGRGGMVPPVISNRMAAEHCVLLLTEWREDFMESTGLPWEPGWLIPLHGQHTVAPCWKTAAP